MLDDGNIALDHIFAYAYRNGIMLDGKVPGISTHLMDGFIQQVARTRLDLTDRPVRAANVLRCRKGAIFIGGIGVHKILSIVKAILSSGEGCIALGLALFTVALGKLHREFLQDIGEFHSGHLTGINRHGLGILRHIAVFRQLGNGVIPRLQVIDLDFPIGASLDGLVYAIPCDLEREALHDAILRGLNDLGGTVTYFQVHKALDGIADRFGKRSHVLNTAAHISIRPGDHAIAGGLLIGGDGHELTGRFGCCDDELVTLHRTVDAGLTGREAERSHHVVFIGENRLVLAAIPFKLKGLGAVCALAHEAGQLGVILYVCGHAVVVAHDLVIQRMAGADLIQHCVIAAGVHLLEVGIPFPDHGFPDEELGSDQVGQVIRTCILAAPVQGDVAGIAILEDPANKGLDLIRRNGAVEIRGIVIPKVLIPLGQHIPGVLCDTRLDAVAGDSRIGTHGPDRCLVGTSTCPAIHIVEVRMAPIAAIVGIPVTGERDHIDLRLLASGIGSGRSKTDKTGEAQKHRHKCGEAPLENACFRH